MTLQRALAAGAMVAGLGMVAVLGAMFLWPGTPVTHREVDLGAVEDYARGTVTTYRLSEEHDAPVELGALARHNEECVREPDMVVHLVRLEDGEFVALSAKSPHLGETMPWLTDAIYPGQPPDEVGVFQDLCHSETFAMDGTRLYGPAPRDMDRFDVRIEDGRVLVDPRTLTEGTNRSSRPGETPTPAATTTPTTTARRYSRVRRNAARRPTLLDWRMPPE
ncbi:MAG: hypothetical protein WD800_01445 [Dehalococcoidia bacterium]